MKKTGIGWIFSKTKQARVFFFLLAIAGILISIVNMGMTTILMNLVNLAAGETNQSLWGNVLLAVFFLILEGIMGIITAVSYRVSINRTSQLLRQEMSMRLYRAPLIQLQSKHTGQFMTNLTTDVEQVSECIPSILRKTIANGLSAILALGYLFLLNWKMALILLCTIPLLIICVASFSPVLQRTSKKDKQNEESIRVYLQEILDKIIILKTCNMDNAINEKMNYILCNKVSSAKRLGLVEGASAFLNNVLGTAMMMISMAGGAFFVIQGELEVGALIGIVQLSNYIIWPFTALGDIMSKVNQSIVSAQRLNEIYELPSYIQKEKQKEGTWEITDVNIIDAQFSYGDICILDHASASFYKGYINGIIGESGSGKSTLLKIISGLYSIDQGQILIESNGQHIATHDISAYCAYVPTDQLIFRDTVAGNICMAKQRDNRKLKNCAKLANIEGFIQALDEGYDTLIGDGQLNLSSGQMQRIAIARALYQDKEIILFDEPTANLDIESIDIFIKTLNQVKEKYICIVATHDERLKQVCSNMYEVKENKLCKY